jgi:hypothetical protein
MADRAEPVANAMIMIVIPSAKRVRKRRMGRNPAMRKSGVEHGRVRSLALRRPP